MTRVCLFGHPLLLRGGTRAPLALPPKAVVLLALLAGNADRPIAREWLASVLWPDTDLEDARANLRRHLHLALKAIGEDAVTVHRQTVQWNTAGSVEADVVAFDAARASDPDAAAAAYVGDLCTGIADLALDDLRLRYRSRYDHLLRTQVEAARKAGEAAAERSWLGRLIAFDPLDEAAVCALMHLRASAGDRAGALRDFAALRARLRSEIGVEPRAETLAVFAAIAADDAPTATPHNLPAATTTFVGREGELDAIVGALTRGANVAIVGPAGSGKTRLALRAAHELGVSFPDGVWFVALDHRESEASLWEGIRDAARMPVLTAEPAETVLSTLRGKRALLVLDTCERLIPEVVHAIERLSGIESVRVLATSRRPVRAPETSELAIGGLPLPPHILAPDDSPLRYAGYRLFIERAALANPELRVAAEDVADVIAIVHALDALPFPIELVASRTRALGIAGLRSRLHRALRGGSRNDGGARSTLESTLDWSYDVLAPLEARVFRAIGIFADRFGMDEVDALLPDVACDDALVALVDASLVSVVGSGRTMRYRLLETTRTFARERLDASPERVEIRRAYAETAARRADALAAASEDRFASLLDDVLAAMPDDLAALRICGAEGWGELGLRILAGIYRFGLRHHSTRAMRAAAQPLIENASIPSVQRARAMRLAATLAENEDALELFAGAIEHYRATDDRIALADALNGAGATFYNLGRRDECRVRLIEAKGYLEGTLERRLLLKTNVRLASLATSYDEAFALLAPAVEELLAIGEMREAMMQLRNLATRAYFHGLYGEAILHARRALEIAPITAELGIAMILHSTIARAHAESDTLDEALRAHLHALGIAANLGSCIESAECMEDAAMTLTRVGAHADAARIYGFSDAVRRALDWPLHDVDRSSYERYANAMRDTLGRAFDGIFREGASDSFDDASARTRAALERALELSETPATRPANRA